MAYYRNSTYDRQSRNATLAEDKGQWNSTLPLLLSQDATNVGQQSVELPYALFTKRRSRDYSYTASFFNGLIGADATNAGLQTVELPPRSAARSRDYTFTLSLFNGLLSQDAVNPGTQQLELPKRNIVRASDYSFSVTLFSPLIGADALVTGIQISGNAPNGRRRSISLSDIALNLLPLLTIVVENPPTALQLLDLPKRNIVRLQPNGLILPLQQQLIGTDSLPNGVGGQLQRDWPNPLLPTRSRDYTWLQNVPQVFFELPIGRSTDEFALKLIGALRSRNYTYIHQLQQQLIGQDVLYGAPGEVPSITFINPRGYRRSRSLYILDTVDILGLQTAPPIILRDLDITISQPLLGWLTGNPILGWTIGNPRQ